MVKYATRIIRNQKSSNQTKNAPQPKRLSPPFLPRCVFPSSLKTSFALLGARFDSVYDISLLGTGRKKRGKLSSLLSYFAPWNKSSMFIFPITSKLLSSQKVWRLPCLDEWGFSFAIRFSNDDGYEIILLDVPHFFSHMGYSPKRMTDWTSLSLGYQNKAL